MAAASNINIERAEQASSRFPIPSNPEAGDALASYSSSSSRSRDASNKLAGDASLLHSFSPSPRQPKIYKHFADRTQIGLLLLLVHDDGFWSAPICLQFALFCSLRLKSNKSHITIKSMILGWTFIYPNWILNIVGILFYQQFSCYYAIWIFLIFKLHYLFILILTEYVFNVEQIRFDRDLAHRRWRRSWIPQD